MAKTYRELVVWQLADDLRSSVIQMSARCWATGDHDFLRDIRRSARSVAANTAEGHGRFGPGEFHRFLVIAKASLHETENHLADGLKSGHFAPADHDAAQALVRRTTVAMTRLMSYLRSAEAAANAKRLARRNPQNL